MKIRSLFLGSVAAAGLTTGVAAADLGVLTSLDVCDALGLSGLTISSDTNCLQISGNVSYDFVWGDYAPGLQFAGVGGPGGVGVNVINNNGVNDWDSRVQAWLRFIGTADSDFGPARANIRIDFEDREVGGDLTTASVDQEVRLHEAWVSVGDQTVLMAGRKASIANYGDDDAFNYLGLFSNGVSVTGSGIRLTNNDPQHVIQVTTNLGNGFTASFGLENLDDTVDARAGQAVGVIAYSGSGLSAHITGVAGGILDGTVDTYAIHAGATASFDAFRVRGAFASSHETATGNWNWQVLGTAEATFDLFTLAASAKYADSTTGTPQLGVGGSVGVSAFEGVTINLGARYFDPDTTTTGTTVATTEFYQVQAQLVAAVTENLNVTGEVGLYGRQFDNDTVLYGAAELGWNPGGGFTSSLRGEINDEGGYRATFRAAKAFQ